MKFGKILVLAGMASFIAFACDKTAKDDIHTPGEGEEEVVVPPSEEEEEDDFVTEGTSTLTLPYVISDRMVLQQKTDACIWGKATPGAQITISASWTTEKFKTKVPDDGLWKIALKTPSASFDAATITITDSQGGSKTLNDVLIGEVWLTTGQSNMRHTMKGYTDQPIQDSEKELQDADIPSFRYFEDKYQLSVTPKFNTVSSSWQKSTPTAALGFQAIAYFFGRRLSRNLNVPVGIIGCAYGGSRIEAWMSLESLSKFPDDDWKNAEEVGLGPGETSKQGPEQVFNGMLLPVINYTVKGILWYQGESNTDNYYSYPALQQEMVRLWRELKGDTENRIPFYYVQLASYNTTSALWPKMQAAQLEGLSLIPNSGIIPAYDCGGPTIHYPDKRTPAERLAMMAEAYTYRSSIENPMAPRFVSVEFSGREAIVTLDNATGLHLGNGEERILHGKLAGNDGEYKGAIVEIRDNKLVFSSSLVTAPEHVSFCYEAWGVGGNVYNSAGLPVFPFQY